MSNRSHVALSSIGQLLVSYRTLKGTTAITLCLSKSGAEHYLWSQLPYLLLLLSFSEIRPDPVCIQYIISMQPATTGSQTTDFLVARGQATSAIHQDTETARSTEL